MLSLGLARAGADVYAFEGMHSLAARICDGIHHNNLQDRVALFDIALMDHRATEVWCSLKGNFAHKMPGMMCTYDTTASWFGNHVHELVEVHDAATVFGTALRDVFDSKLNVIILRTGGFFTEGFFASLLPVLDRYRNVEQIWASTILAEWEQLDYVEALDQMEELGFVLMNDYCSEVLKRKASTYDTTELLFSRNSDACRPVGG